jgi:23S rRNA (cytidine1920-2'-O)/16S rRNA (cytidine1409-2'-O)-methyltransferase
LVDDTSKIEMVSRSRRFVSRGGEKLAAAISTFHVAVEGVRCLDAGASTGGFTDCLLQAGAREVVAVDVGYGQLAWRLRRDPRVRVVERTNIRVADASELGAPFDIVVADLSFISLCTVAPFLVRCGTDVTDYLLLVKPQFEAGRKQVGKGGIVRDPEVHKMVVEKVSRCLGEVGIRTRGVIRSPLEGADGNIEFLLWAGLEGQGKVVTA